MSLRSQRNSSLKKFYVQLAIQKEIRTKFITIRNLRLEGRLLPQPRDYRSIAQPLELIYPIFEMLIYAEFGPW